MEMAKVLAQLKKVEPNELFTFIGVTQIESTKKSRITNDPTPSSKGYIKKVVVMSAILGGDYEKLVNNLREKEGSLPMFKANESYSFPISENGLLHKHKDKEQFYIQIYPNKCKATKCIEFYYDTNGNELTCEEFKAWMREYGVGYSNGNEKQAAHQGLQEALEVRRYKVENIKGLKHGNEKIDPDPELLATLNKFIKW